MLEYYWNSLPIGKENAVDYDTLCVMWGRCKRVVRRILHDLSLYDSGDNYILIRSGKYKGFYRTDDKEIIEAFRKECINKAKSNFAPLKKINRIINEDIDTQLSLYNNMRNARINKGLKQKEVVEELRKYDKGIDEALLSKYENSVCVPTPYQLCLFARIYGCTPSELINTDLVYQAI